MFRKGLEDIPFFCEERLEHIPDSFRLWKAVVELAIQKRSGWQHLSLSLRTMSQREQECFWPRPGKQEAPRGFG